MTIQLVMIKPTKNAELFTDIEQVGPQELVGNNDQRGNHGHFHNHADAVGDHVPQQRNYEVGEGDHRGQRQRHYDRGIDLDRYREGRADAEYLYGNRVVVRKRIHQKFLSSRSHD